MRRPLRRTVIAFLLLFIPLLLIWRYGGKDAGRPVDARGRHVLVADGDTLKIGTETIRLAGLDAVERAQFCMDGQGKAWSCGQAAVVALQDAIADGAVQCTAIEHDRYGRTVARCMTGKRDIGAAMVAQGWAIGKGSYDREESVARTEKRGIWAGTFETPSVWRERTMIEPKMVRHPD